MSMSYYRGVLHAAVCALACSLSVACGNDTPTAPGGPNGTPSFLTGQVGFTVGSDESVCTQKTPAWGFFGPQLIARVAVAADGQEFAARAEGRLGDAEMRFRVTPTTSVESTVSGTARGTLYDLLSVLQFPNPSHVTISGTNSGAAELTGVYHPQFRGASGRLSGTIVFTDNQAGVMTCTEAIWVMVSGTR
jgi:hypothetical protein